MNVLVPQGFVDWALSLNPWTVTGVLLGIAIVLIAATGLMKQRALAVDGKRLNRRQLEMLASRWQLLLLGSTGFVLSLASGYTTWSGMTNFTGESTLSLMVTFGIQGVMLIVAWLIGESFATGMNRQQADGRPAVGRFDAAVGMLLALVLVAVVFYWILHQSQALSWNKTGALDPVNWVRFADVAAYFALGLIVVGVLAFNFSRGGELSLPYVQSSRVIIKNAVLWVMFLACMGTSVFFSFDSLFTAIFPKDERARAANLRAQNQVGGMVADIGTTIADRRVAEIDHLFASKGWIGYEEQLVRLGQASQGAQKQIEDFFNDQLEQRNRAVKQQQERITSAQSSSAGLQSKKTTLTDEIARLKGERPALAADYTEKKNELDNRAKGVDAKRVEAQAEDRGAEGTLKQGKGPIWRQITAELARLQDAYKIQDERVRDAQRRLAQTDTRIAQIERELASVDGDLAKLKGEAETAEQRIKLTQDQLSGDTQPRIDPGRVLPAFERARLEFRQEPTREKLAALHHQCTQLYGAMNATPATRGLVRGVDCDPKQASEAAAVMFALNEGLKAFETACAGGEKLNAHTTTDGLYGFARKCLSDSGLPSRETDLLRTKINYLELSRDDKAHPFVATLNAFQDGNKLAYLALAIAIAMDALVFMSGLFGANAVRSPLSDVPSSKARSGRQLESIIDAALLPHTYETAELVLDAMKPMTKREGYSARVLVRDDDPHAQQIRRVLNAGSTIGAVRHVEGRDELYEVREEIFEYLNEVKKKAFHADDEHGRLADLRKVMTVALQPHTGDHADMVLHHCRPISEKNGFSSEIYLSRMDDYDRFYVGKAINAGATLNYVQHDDRADQEPLERYYVHRQLYKTLLLISAANPRKSSIGDLKRLWLAQREGVQQIEGPTAYDAGARNGGALSSQMQALQNDAGIHPQLPGFVDRMAAAYAQQNGPRQRQPASGGREDLQRYFVAHMVEALGIEPDAYLDVGDAYSPALAASEAFKAVQRTNRSLDDQVEACESQAQSTVDEIHGRLLASPYAQTETGAAALQDAYTEVLQNLGIIVLLPNGPVERLLKSLVGEMEDPNGAGELRPDQQNLLRLAKRLGDHLARSGRNGADAWLNLEGNFIADHPASSPIAIFNAPNKRNLR